MKQNALRLVMWSTFHTSNDLGMCSAVNMCIDLCEVLYKELKGRFHVIFVGPPENSALKLPDRLVEAPWATILPNGPEKIWMFRPFPSDKLFEKLNVDKTNLCFDAVFLRDIFHGGSFAYGLVKRTGAWYLPIEIPIITYMNESLNDSNVMCLSEKAGRVAVMSSAMASDALVFHNKFEYDLFLSMARQYLASSECSAILNKSHIIAGSGSLDHITSKLSSYETARDKRIQSTGKLNLFHSGTFQTKRNLPAISLALDKLTTPQRFNFVISSQQSGDFTCKNVSVDLRLFQTREDYYKNLADGDILICMTESETTGIGYNEAIASGMIPVVLNRPWITSRLPEKYPFVVNNIEKELPVLLDWIGKNFSEAQLKARDCRQTIQKESTESLIPKWLNMFSNIANKSAEKHAAALSGIRGMMYYKKALEKCPDEFVGTALLKEKAEIEAANDGVSLRLLNDLALRYMIITSGYTDLGGRVPLYKKDHLCK